MTQIGPWIKFQTFLVYTMYIVHVVCLKNIDLVNEYLIVYVYIDIRYESFVRKIYTHCTGHMDRRYKFSKCMETADKVILRMSLFCKFFVKEFYQRYFLTYNHNICEYYLLEHFMDSIMKRFPIITESAIFDF